MSLTPTREDKFSFGLWTIGWVGQDQFGSRQPGAAGRRRGGGEAGRAGRVRPHLPRQRPVPVRGDRRRAQQQIDRLQKALADTGLVVPMVTTNLFSHPVFKDGGFTSNDRSVRRYALRKVMRNLDLAAELGAETFVIWGGREGSEFDARQGRPGGAGPLSGGDGHAGPVRHRPGLQRCGSPSSPSRTSRAATSCCPPSVTPWPSSTSLDQPDMFGINPEIGHEQMASLNFTHGIAQALWRRQAVPHRPQRAERIPFDQDLVFGHGDLLQAFSAVDLLENGGPAAGRPTTGPGTSTTSRCAPRTSTVSGSPPRPTCGSTCCLKERARAFRADPEVQQALEAGRVAELSQPTLSDGETYADLTRRPAARTRTTTSRTPGPRATASPVSSGWPSNTSSGCVDRDHRYADRRRRPGRRCRLLHPVMQDRRLRERDRPHRAHRPGLSPGRYRGVCRGVVARRFPVPVRSPACWTGCRPWRSADNNTAW